MAQPFKRKGGGRGRPSKVELALDRQREELLDRGLLNERDEWRKRAELLADAIEDFAVNHDTERLLRAKTRIVGE